VLLSFSLSGLRHLESLWNVYRRFLGIVVSEFDQGNLQFVGLGRRFHGTQRAPTHLRPLLNKIVVDHLPPHPLIMQTQITVLTT